MKVSAISSEFFEKNKMAVPLFFSFLHTAFGQKRKTLAHTLTKLAPRQKIEEALRDLGLPSTARPEELTKEQWANLISKIGVF